MQKLQAKSKNVPMNASLVPCSITLPLNREETLSVVGKSLTCNNLEVNLRQQHTGGLKDMVYVFSVEGKPLMPCSKTKARHLLEAGHAKVIGKYPFRIQLLFVCENQTQEVVLGIDPGYKHIGFSCKTDKKELISGEVILENGMSKRLEEKKMYRRGRRNKLWYRESRFDNRGNAKQEDRLMPSVRRRLDVHTNLATRLTKLLPISQVNIEVANFDIQRINDPSLEGSGYQQGSLYGYENVKAYILTREQGQCQLCGKEYDKQGWHLHHVISRSNGGTDKPDNLALLHQKCHDKLHRQKLFGKLKEAKQYKAETFMSTIRWMLADRVRLVCDDVETTYGCDTKMKRVDAGLDKTHNNDAFVIAGGNKQRRSRLFTVRQKRHNNRCLQLNRNGHRPSIRRSRSVIQPGDILLVAGKEYISKGMLDFGKRVLVGDMKKREYFKTGQVEKCFHVGSWNFSVNRKEDGIPPKAKALGSSAINDL